MRDCFALGEPEFAEDKEALARLLQSIASEEVSK